nr:MAG TPA: SmD3, SmB (1-95), SmD1 (1-85) snRNP, Spliceosome, Pre-mRNA splicing [Caudoviricetes sp.]
MAENKSFCTNCPNYYCYYCSVEREFIRTLFLRGTVELPF